MGSSGGGRVLLVDPTGDLEGRLGETLADAGFDVATVDAATECVRIVEERPPDAVVCDDRLPDNGGLRLLRFVRLSRPTLPFVLAPTAVSSVSADEAAEASANGFLPPDATAEAAVSLLRDCITGDRNWLDREGDLRYRHLIEISPAPVNLFDAAGVSIWGNDAVLDLLGLDDRAELIGRSIFDFIHPDDHELAREELGDVIERKENVGPTSMRLKRPDGEVRHIQVSTAIGRLLGADIGQAVIVDVTELREAQQALRAERDFIEETLDTLQDIFYVVDLEGDLLQWNAAATTVGGYTDDELASMTIGDFFDEEDARRVAESMRTVVREGSDTVEVSLQTKGGRSIPYEFRGRLLAEDEGGKPRIVGIGRDVSDRKERDRQLKALDQWLRHNIRNDINVIQGIASNITEYGTGDVRENARTIQAHASDLVDQADRERAVVDLLTGPPDRRPVDVAALVERAVQEVADRFPSADVQIGHLDDDSALAVPALGTAIVELLENAIEHNRDDEPTVQVSVTADDETVTVHLADDGPGIPRSETEVLLEGRDIDQLHHSTGMGLMFVSTVISVSGGSIDIAANEPRGSVVTITLEAAGAP